MKHKLSNIDEVERTAVCAACGLVKIHARGNGRYRCGESKNATRRERHGLTTNEGRALRDGASCAICGSTECLKVDHDHSTMQVRGVLCHNCNVAIGFMKDSPDLLRKAAAYLE